jgi:hypothetical protein
MEDSSTPSKVDPDELTWVEKLLSVLAQTSSYEFEYAVGHAKGLLAAPVAMWLLVVAMAIPVMAFGPNAPSRALIWIFHLFQHDGQSYLYPAIAASSGWMGMVQSYAPIVLILIAFAIGYQIVNRYTTESQRLPKIEVGIGWKIGAWTGSFLLMLLPILGAGEATNLISEYAPDPEPFDRLPPDQEISLSGEPFELERTGSTVLHDGSIKREHLRRTGKYLENIGLLREGRLSEVRVSTELTPTEDTTYQVEVPIAQRWRDNRALKKVARMLAKDLSVFVDGYDNLLPMQVILVSESASGQLFRDTTTVVTDTSEVQEYTLSSVYRCCMHRMSER